MSKQSERVKKMLAGFMNLHEQGFSIPEIAQEFGLTSVTVYAYLQEIADNNGVTRESLLQQVHKTNSYFMTKNRQIRTGINEAEGLCDQAMKEVQALIEKIGNIDSIMEVSEYEC